MHPRKSACWSHSAPRDSLPETCQRIWKENGLKVGGIPVFNPNNEATLARDMLEKRLEKIENEAEFLTSVLFDDQLAAADSWSRVQATVLLLRYSLAAKLVYFGQTIESTFFEPYAQRFDDIVLRTSKKVCEIVHLSKDQKLQVQLAVREGGFDMRSHALKSQEFKTGLFDLTTLK